MEIDWTFHQCSGKTKEHLRAYWYKKTASLSRLLTRFAPELSRLRLAAYCDDGRHRIRAVLTLPTGVLIAEQSHEQPLAAVDLLMDLLTREIERHKGRLRRDYLERRRARQRECVAAASAILVRDAERGDRTSFVSLLVPLLDSIKAHTRRELRILELQGNMSEGSVTAADLLTDVVMLGWERFANRPPSQPLDLWLLGLAHERLAGLAAATERGEPAASSGLRWPEEPDARDQLLGYAQSPLLGELVVPPGEPPEALMESPEMRSRILEHLVRMPGEQRSALLLHAFEGLEPHEIASVQGRSSEAVRRDLEQARGSLRAAIR